MKNVIFGITILLIIGGFSYAVYQFGKQQSFQENVQADTTNTATASPQLVGNDRDEHGCIGSAGYSWCEARKKCLRVWEEKCEAVSDNDLVKQALLKKHNWNENEVTITVSTNDGKYAKGTVNQQGGGGLFFAAKSNGVWEIVADGNGMITCSSLVNYPDFPNTLIPTCYVEATGKIVKR